MELFGFVLVQIKYRFLFHYQINVLCTCLRECVCVCVCEHERKTETEQKSASMHEIIYIRMDTECYTKYNTLWRTVDGLVRFGVYMFYIYIYIYFLKRFYKRLLLRFSRSVNLLLRPVAFVSLCKRSLIEHTFFYPVSFRLFRIFLFCFTLLLSLLLLQLLLLLFRFSIKETTSARLVFDNTTSQCAFTRSG